MLTEVRLRDLGVIAEATLVLGPGLNVVTGETGAGKTMLLTGLGLLLGNRADSTLVRTGRPRVEAEGWVSLPADHPCRRRVEEAGGDVEDELVLARTVSAEGRSRAYAGGRSVPSGVLAEVGELLVAVHGQADQWRLRKVDAHADLLDTLGGPAVRSAKEAYQQAHDTLGRLRAHCEELRTRAGERVREADRLREGLESIERVNPRPGEDHELRAEGARLDNVEVIRSALAQAHDAITADPDGGYESAAGAIEAITAARTRLAPALDHDDRLGDLDRRLADIGYQLADIVSDLATALAELDADPGRLEWVHQRRAELAALVRRYGADVDDVLAWGSAASARLLDLDTADERLDACTAELAEATRAFATAAADLSAVRRNAAPALAADITAEIAQLAMGRAGVQIEVSTAYELDRAPRSGLDRVDIMIEEGNQPPRSITRSVSGGELARLMLAIEVVAARRAPQSLPTLLFDEVDAGVGGAAALSVGARLAEVAAAHQVIVVTHLAQVAAYADRHLVVTKDAGGSVTTSTVRQVEGAERLAELSRMMSGDGASEAGLAHAEDLLAQVDSRRRRRKGRSRVSA